MKILVVGSGGREHALVWAVRKSPRVEEVECAPGNAGIARLATCVPIDPGNVAGLAAHAASREIDLTIVGPEVPLTLGIREEFTRRGLSLFGASRQAAEIESSKVFAKAFMRRIGLPTAESETFDDPEQARLYLESAATRYPLVVKADGLAAGKGVVVCADRAQALESVRSMMVDHVHGVAGQRILVEEFLEGREASLFVLTDGTRVLPFATCQDYKRAQDGDSGPNTGGMGAYSPSAALDAAAFDEIVRTIAVPTIAGLAAEGRPYVGILYLGLMLTGRGPYVLEYNARFGDPETQAMLPRLATDLVPLLASAAAGRLDDIAIAWSPRSAATVVAAAPGYPGPIRKGMTIQGIEQAEALEDVTVFCAGVSQGPSGEPTVGGGRVLAVTALGDDLPAAIARAYEGIDLIRFEGMHYRRDIGRDALTAAASGGPR